jgi:hypothetical protein
MVVLDFLASAMTAREMMREHSLGEADIRACIACGAEMARALYVELPADGLCCGDSAIYKHVSDGFPLPAFAGTSLAGMTILRAPVAMIVIPAKAGIHLHCLNCTFW